MNIEKQKERLEAINLTVDDSYYTRPDNLGRETEVPDGYKKCGHCKEVKKLYLFNKDSSTKLGVCGNCKDCQKKAAAKSYKKTKKHRKAHQSYEANKEYRREFARKYYAEHTEECKEMHEKYLKSKRGKKTMREAQKRRRTQMAENAGIPYTREDIIKRDSTFIGLEHPVCSLCGKPILDTSGQNAHIDHIIGIAAGGKDCFTNVRLVHKTCNLSRPKDLRDLKDDAEIKKIEERTAKYLEAGEE